VNLHGHLSGRKRKHGACCARKSDLSLSKKLALMERKEKGKERAFPITPKRRGGVLWNWTVFGERQKKIGCPLDLRRGERKRKEEV